ncbi:MAG: hypothetical protein GY817_00670 [bacterium]|nr:hypothetical protein [bacterium]
MLEPKNCKNIEEIRQEIDQIAEEIIAFLKPIVELQHNLSQTVHLLEKLLTDISKPYIEFTNKFINTITPALIKLSKDMDSLDMDSLLEKTKKAVLTLGEKGWFLDIEMPLTYLQKFHNEIKNGNIEQAENALIIYFEERLDAIEKSLIEKFPNRKSIFLATFKAHKNKDYVLSIPILLAQSDGICYEKINQHFFLD